MRLSAIYQQGLCHLRQQQRAPVQARRCLGACRAAAAVVPGQQPAAQRRRSVATLAMRTLLLDNYDSYTYNLFQIIAEVNGVPPLVRFNDEVTLEQVQELLASGAVQNVVISPGPGTPSEPADIGVCLDVLRTLTDVPILGVCLGHQAMALVHGGAVVRAPEPVHGRLSTCHHSGHPLFAGVPSGDDYQVVRYHSLLVDEQSLPECLVAICWTAGSHTAVHLDRDDDAACGAEASRGPGCCSSAAAAASGSGSQREQPLNSGGGGSVSRDLQQQLVGGAGQSERPFQVNGSTGPAGPRLVMGIAHRSQPHYGVQFHPESVATRYGIALLRNFRDLSCKHLGLPPPSCTLANLVGPPGRLLPRGQWPSPSHQQQQQQQQHGPPLRLAWRKCFGALAALGGSLPLFEALFGWQHDTFWLDSAATDRGRFSYMGGRGGPLWRRLTFRLPPPSAAGAAQPFSATPSAGDALATAPNCVGPSRGGSSSSSSSDALPGVSSRQPGPPSTSGSDAASARSGCAAPGLLTVENADGATTETSCSFLEHLDATLRHFRLHAAPQDVHALPFNFWGGLVGYLGYELKAECGGARAHASPAPDAVMHLADRLVAVDHATQDVYVLALYEDEVDGGSRGAGDEPSMATSSSAGVCRAATQAVVNAAAAVGPAVGPAPPPAWPASEALAREWVDSMAARVQQLAVGAAAGTQQDTASSTPRAGQTPVAHRGLAEAAPATAACRSAATALMQRQGDDGSHAQQGRGATEVAPATAPASAPLAAPPPFRLAHDREQYLDNIAACRAALFAGESYEVCLTTALVRSCAPDGPELYKTLRALNPAPYAAWLQCGPQGPTVCCSSPERFLRGDRGGVLEARPIKGTAARQLHDQAADAAAALELAYSEKERAENLMIVDLLRNDLGRVCEVGSVHVPGLMEIESYATVHQMVSTIRGVRRTGCSAVDCVRAAFPGGSMTGAPKVRTMQIIDEVEGRARGIYSGCIGFFGFNDTFDLNIVIRTAVLQQDGSMTIGAGGAIVVQSDPAAEFDEMRLKARALVRAVGLCDGTDMPDVV